MSPSFSRQISWTLGHTSWLVQPTTCHTFSYSSNFVWQLQVLGPEWIFPTLYEAVSFVKATQLQQAELAGAALRTAAKMDDIFDEPSQLHVRPNPTYTSGAGGSSRDTATVNGVTRNASPGAAQRFSIASRGAANAQGVAGAYELVSGSRGGALGNSRGLQRPSAVPRKVSNDERKGAVDERRPVLLTGDGDGGAVSAAEVARLERAERASLGGRY